MKNEKVAKLLKTLKVSEVLRAQSDVVESADVFAEKLAHQLGLVVHGPGHVNCTKCATMTCDGNHTIVPTPVELLARAIRRRDKDIVRTLVGGAVSDKAQS